MSGESLFGGVLDWTIVKTGPLALVDALWIPDCHAEETIETQGVNRR